MGEGTAQEKTDLKSIYPALQESEPISLDTDAPAFPLGGRPFSGCLGPWSTLVTGVPSWARCPEIRQDGRDKSYTGFGMSLLTLTSPLKCEPEALCQQVSGRIARFSGEKTGREGARGIVASPVSRDPRWGSLVQYSI